MTATASGRPVRFFALVMTAWVAIRLIDASGDLLPGPKPAERAAPQRGSAKMLAAETRARGLITWQLPARALAPPPLAFATPRRNAMQPISFLAPLPVRATAAPAEHEAAQPFPTINPTPAVPLAPQASPHADRWHGSAWLLWREGSAARADALAGGRLGGSQAGVRVDYDLTPQASSRATVYARFNAALNRPASPEAALGLAWQPARTVPISFAAERRIALGKGARDANAVMAVGGFGPQPIAPSLEVEAYAQGGMVGFRSNDFFVDGKMSLLSPIRHTPLRIGTSLSGGAQPQVERLDIGPEVQVRLPLRPVGARLGIEWRQRIAGQAAPASGLAVTLGADF